MTAPRTERHGQSRVTRRTALGAGGGGTLALLLAGCGDTSRIAAGTAVASDGAIALPAVTPLLQSATSAVELPGVRYEVYGTNTEEFMTREMARKIGLPVPDGDDLDKVLPARGEVFFVSILSSSKVHHMPSWQVTGEVTERVLVDGIEIESPPQKLAQSAPEGLLDLVVVASVPEGELDPEHLVFESTLGEVTQRLSLVDGSRLSSDVEHVYGPHTTLTVADNWWEYTGKDLSERLAGFLLAGRVVPALPDGTWAAPGTMLVSLLVSNLPLVGDPETSTVTLVLPDGSEAPASGDHSLVFEAVEGGGEAWFEVPLDTESATARVDLSTDGTVLATEEIAVTFARQGG